VPAATGADELFSMLADAIHHCERLAFIVDGDLRPDQAMTVNPNHGSDLKVCQ
jgi:hypothetical protein